ncbi:MAG: hypothetical protein ACOC0P_06350, partial [Planctomycetota bacterium]
WWSVVHLPRGAWVMAGIVSAAHQDLKHARGIAWADLHYEVASKDEAPSQRRDRSSRRSPSRAGTAEGGDSRSASDDERNEHVSTVADGEGEPGR